MNQIINTYRDAFAGLSGEVWKLASMMLINRIGTLIMPFLTLYATVELGWSVTDGGIAASCFGFGSLAGAYLGGVLTDQIGYYKTMMMGLVLAAVLFFLAQYITEFYAFCLIIFAGSMAADVLRPALYTGLRFITDETTQTRAISLLRMAFNLGIAVGPAVAGLLVVSIGYRSIFVIDALTCGAAAIFMFVFLPNHEPQGYRKQQKEDAIGQAVQSPYKDGPFLIFLLSNLLMLTAFFQIVSTVPLYIKEYLGMSETAVGAFYTVNGLIIFVFEMLIIRYIEKHHLSKFNALIYGAVMMGVALLCLAVPSVYLLPVIMYSLLVSFGEIINFPFISTTSMDRSTDAARGKYMGLTSMSFSLALIIAPILGTMLLTAYGFQVMFAIMFLINMVGVGGYYLCRGDLS